MVSCGMSVVKYLLFVFNFVFVIIGIALIAVGATVQSKAKDYFDLSDKYTTASVILIVVGIVIFLLSFFACCGAIKENRCMVMTFAVLLFIICVIEIAAAIVAFVYKDKLEDYLKQGMLSGMQNYGKPGHKVVTDVWDDLQKELKCCGDINAADWLQNTLLHVNQSTPDSCCLPSNRAVGCGYGQAAPGQHTHVFLVGCFDKVLLKLKNQTVVVGGVGIGLAFVQTLGLVFACCLANAIKKQYESV